MWKAPYRPRQSEISQSYNDGVVTIYGETDTAKPGYQPKPELKMKGVLHFCELRLGLQRFYAGKQNQINIERVLRVPRGFVINSQDVAIITGCPQQYRIDLVQTVENVYPASLDLTLFKITQQIQMPEEGGAGRDLA